MSVTVTLRDVVRSVRSMSCDCHHQEVSLSMSRSCNLRATLLRERVQCRLGAVDEHGSPL